MTYKIVSKYIKDLSFEIAGAKAYFLLEKNIKNFLVNFDIKSQKINQNVIEVDTTLYLSSKKDTNLTPISICLSSLVNFEKEFEKKEMEKIILVEVPKIVYTEIRQTLCYLFEKSGFKNVDLQKEINFEKLYENKKS